MRVERLAAGVLRVEELERLGQVLRYHDYHLAVVLDIGEQVLAVPVLVDLARPTPQGLVVLHDISPVERVVA